MAVNSSSWFSMNYRMSSKANGILICFIVLLTEGVFGNHFINHFAVHIPGGPVVATKIAQENGYLVKGQIGSLENHFLFEHPHVHKRSARRNEEHHETLSGHPEVHWFEQQRLVSRKKRDFLPIPADIASDLESESRTQLESKSRSRRDVKNQEIHFNDQLYSHMWYFNGGGLNHTDMNVIGAWKRGVTGKDVVITILDDGLERTHDDIKDNYDPYASYDVNGHKADPMPRYDYTNENRHGTRCAGEVSAKANNTKCIVGVAYNSKIGGVRMLDGDVYDAVEATSLSHNRSHIDIYSASWGPDDDGRVVDGPGILAKKAFVDGVRLGRNGKGAIFVWASGNGGRMKDSCSCDGYTNSIYTLSISAISQRMNSPFYLEECASTIATTFSSGSGSEQKIVTVDLHNKCTETHTGTSASAPLAAGIVALSLEVNPTLTWRDVQYITLMTARPLPDGEWVTNGVGRQVSLRYGYGLMDATAMVELAEKWTNVPEQHLCEVKSQKAGTPGKPVRIPDSGYSEILDTNACAGTPNAINFLEHVQAKFTIKSKRRGDLVIKLISPMGTKSTILPQRPNDSDRLKGFNGWAFLSVHFWGENPVGKWKLEVEVRQNNHGYIGSSYSGTQMTNDLVEWSLILYGVEENPVNLVSPTQAPPPSVQTTNSGSCHSLCLGGCTGPQPDQCNDCKTYKIEATGKCVQSCPNNLYADEFSCKPCDSTCETCTYISSKEIMCLKCKPGFLLVEGKGTCVQVCEKGYYKDNNLHHCRVCSGMCAECEENSKKCTACRQGYELVDNHSCASITLYCNSGQYKTSAGCENCPPGCYSCTSSTNCTCCNKGSYLQNGICVHSCDSGYLPFHVNYSSKFVFQQCQHCDDKCNVCPSGFNYINGVCVQQSNCPSGKYFQWSSMTCQLCNSRCKTCIGPSMSDCLSCVPPYGYNNMLRQCMKCCTGPDTSKSGTCCRCIEEGKCEVQTPLPHDPEHLFSLATIIIIILVLLVAFLFFFILVIVFMSCKRKNFSAPGISYKLLNGDDQDNEEA